MDKPDTSPAGRRAFVERFGVALAGIATARLDTGASTAVQNEGATLDVRRFGAVGDGRSDDTAALEGALARARQLGSARRVTLARGIYRISRSVSLPAEVTLEFADGAQLLLASGVTLRIAGVVAAPLHRIFAGEGVAKLGAERAAGGDVYPEWWGAVRDGVTDDGPAINRALAGAPAEGCLRLGIGTYAVATTLRISQAGGPCPHVRGTNMRFSVLKWTGGAEPLILADAAGPAFIDNLLLEEFQVTNSGSGTIGIDVRGVVRVVMHRVFSTGDVGFSGAVVRISAGCYHSALRDCHFQTGGDAPTVGVEVTSGHTVEFDHCMLSGFSTGVKAGGGDGGQSINGLSFLNCRVEAFSATAPGRAYRGGPNAIGIDIHEAIGFGITNCDIEMAADGAPAASTQRCIRLGNARGGLISGCWLSGAGVANALIEIAAPNCSVSIDANAFWRPGGGSAAIVATGTGTLTGVFIGTNYNQNPGVPLVSPRPGQPVMGAIGNFTPSVGFGASSSGVEYRVQFGRYRQDGKLVTAWGRVSLMRKGAGSGNAFLSGLPLVSARDDSENQPPVSIAFAGLAGLGGHVFGILPANSMSIRLYDGGTGESRLLTDANFTDRSEIHFSVVYMTGSQVA